MRQLGWTRDLLAAIALTVFTGWVHLYFFSAPFTGVAADSFVLMALGKNVARGLVPYKDLWEMKPPGIFWYLGGIFSVLPAAVWSLRVVDYVVFVGAGLAFYHLCRMAGAWRPLALIGTAFWLYFAHHPDFNVSAVFTEEYTAIFEVCSMAAAVTFVQRPRPAYAILSGLAAAGAVLFKHPGIAVAVPALLLLSTSLTAVLLFGASFVLPIAATVAYFWHRDALAQFMDCNVWFLLGYGGYSTGVPFTDRLFPLANLLWKVSTESPALLVAAAVGTVTCAFHRSRFHVAAVTWVAADVLTVALENKGVYVNNYLIQLFPSVFFAATLGAAFLLQPQPRERWTISRLRAAAAAAALVVCWSPLKQVYAARRPIVHEHWKVLRKGPSAWQTTPVRPYEREIGQYIRINSVPDDRLLVCASGWSAGPGVSVYWAADRAPASRYFYPHMLTGFRIADHLAMLEETKPRYVLVIDCAGYLDQIQPWLDANYRVVKSFTRDYVAQVWERSDQPAPPPDGVVPPRIPAVTTAAEDIQLVEGVDTVISAPNSAPSYDDHRGGGPSWWTYVEDEPPEITWRTAPAPARRGTIAALTVSSSPERGDAELFVNGHPALSFPFGVENAGGRWQANGYSVAYLSRGYFAGASGILLIGIPADAVTPGHPLEFRLLATGAPRSWFMVKGYHDTISDEVLSIASADRLLRGPLVLYPTARAAP
jgi:hypothetical protein